MWPFQITQTPPAKDNVSDKTTWEQTRWFTGGWVGKSPRVATLKPNNLTPKRHNDQWDDKPGFLKHFQNRHFFILKKTQREFDFVNIWSKWFTSVHKREPKDKSLKQGLFWFGVTRPDLLHENARHVLPTERGRTMGHHNAERTAVYLPDRALNKVERNHLLSKFCKHKVVTLHTKGQPKETTHLKIIKRSRKQLI